MICPPNSSFISPITFSFFSLTGLVLHFLQRAFVKYCNLISCSSCQGKSCEIPQLSAMFVIQTTHQIVASLKQMRDIFMVTELCKYLTRYAHLSQQHS